MRDRQRLSVMLAVEVRLDGGHAAGCAPIALREADALTIAPEHENVALLGAIVFAKAKQFLVGCVGCLILGRQIGVEQPNP